MAGVPPYSRSSRAALGWVRCEAEEEPIAALSATTTTQQVARPAVDGDGDSDSDSE
jgi:hypothetical protein